MSSSGESQDSATHSDPTPFFMTSQQHVTPIARASREKEDISGLGDYRDVPVTSLGSPTSEWQEKGNEEIAGRDDEREDVSSSLATRTHTNIDQELVITTIRAMNVAAGLTRLPAGFYTAVRHSGLEWRTANNKSVSVNNDVIQWSGPIPIPSDLSVTVQLEVYASFEFRPILGQGETLRKLSVTIKQLLDHGEKGLPFTFPSLIGNTASSCSSLLVTVQRRGRNSSTLRALGPHRSITEQLDPLEEATNQGHSAFLRYQKNRATPDLERSIEAFERALDGCSSGHPCRAAAQSNLAMAKLASCQVDNSNLSFDTPITLYCDALAARPTGHPDRPSTLINLAAVYFLRFERQQDAVDATQVGALLREAKDLSAADSHEEQAVISARRRLAERTTGPVGAGGPSSTERVAASQLMDESTSSTDVQLLRRFKHSDDLAALEDAISGLEASISDSVRDPTSLGNLGVALWYRFTRLGQLNDLEQAIERQRDAVHFTPDSHPSKSGRLNNLGDSLFTRFQHLGNLVDLKEAISRHRDAIGLTPKNHPDKPRHLNNLGNCFLSRFERLGKLIDLEQAITMHNDAVRRIPNGHSDKPNLLNNLATSFRTRFKHFNKLDDLNEAILLHRDAVEFTLDSNKPAYLNNLATSFFTRFMYAGELSDLEQAISAHQQAIELTPNGHSDKPRRLNDLANSFFFAHFERLGKFNDLEQAISGHGQAIELTPDGHPDKPKRVNDLANSFRTHFEYLGELSSLEKAFLGHREAMRLAGPNSDSHVYLNSLATSFLTRFKHLGNASDLEEAISWYNKAVELTPNGHRRRPSYLNNLGLSLLTRFEWLGKLDDLEQGISRLREAVALAADSPLEKTNYQGSLGVCLRTRFTFLGQPDDLNEAISTHKQAIEPVPGGCKDKLNRWAHRADVSTTVARSGHRRSEQRDLEQAILSYKEAVRLTSDRHPDKWRRLNNLANCFLARFEQLGDRVDLNRAAELHEDAVALEGTRRSPGGHVFLATH